jgi:hypothetical protein
MYYEQKKIMNIMNVLRTEIGVRSEYLTKEAIKVFAASKIGGDVDLIRTVKYADDLLLVVKEETVLPSMIDRLIEVGRCYGT